MNESRLLDYMEHVAEAARQACSYVDGMEKPAFFADTRTQQAVILNLVIIGEAATRLLQSYDAFLERHPQIPWRSMKGMRNRIAHGYFDIDLEVVWETVRTALPRLLRQLPAAQQDAQAWRQHRPDAG
jgi:uncharacterized protein with HEPN domain